VHAALGALLPVGDGKLGRSLGRADQGQIRPGGRTDLIEKESHLLSGSLGDLSQAVQEQSFFAARGHLRAVVLHAPLASPEPTAMQEGADAG